MDNFVPANDSNAHNPILAGQVPPAAVAAPPAAPVAIVAAAAPETTLVAQPDPRLHAPGVLDDRFPVGTPPEVVAAAVQFAKGLEDMNVDTDVPGSRKRIIPRSTSPPSSISDILLPGSSGEEEDGNEVADIKGLARLIKQEGKNHMKNYSKLHAAITTTNDNLVRATNLATDAFALAKQTSEKLQNIEANIDTKIANAVANASKRATSAPPGPRDRNSIEVRGGGTDYPETRISGWPRFTKCEEFLLMLKQLCVASKIPVQLVEPRNLRPKFIVLQFETLEDRKAFNNWASANNLPMVKVSTGNFRFGFRNSLEPIFAAKSAEVRHCVWWLHSNVQGDTSYVSVDYDTLTVLFESTPILAFGKDKEMQFHGRPTNPRHMVFDPKAFQNFLGNLGIQMDPNIFLQHLKERFPQTTFEAM